MAEGESQQVLLVSLPYVAFVTVTVRAKPGSSKTAVGGVFGEPPQLVVRVTAPAVDGRANAAVREALAESFAVRASDVQIVSGETARTKVIRIHGDVTRLSAALDTFMGAAAASSDLFDD